MKLAPPSKLKASFLKSAAGVTKALPSLATRVVVNVVTQGALSSAAVSKLVESIESAKASQLQKRIAKAHENTQAVNEFRERLSELARQLAQGTTAATEESKPADKATRKFVFIIDELDRCKPTFALNLLERIKHLFSVDEIVFVLVAHLPQLARMVEKEYGVTSGIQYFEKFYRLRIALPVRRATHQSREVQYLDHLFKQMDMRMDEPDVFDHIAEGIGLMAEIYSLPLRTLEQVANNVALVCLATNRRNFRFAPLISGLCVMRIVNPEMYEEARTGRLSLDDAVKFLKFDEWNSERVHTSSVEGHKEAWTYATATDDELRDPQYDDLKKAYGQMLVPFRMTRPDMITATCKQIDDLWQRERK